MLIQKRGVIETMAFMTHYIPSGQQSKHNNMQFVFPFGVKTPSVCVYFFPWFTVHVLPPLLSSDIYMLHWPGSTKPGRSNREQRAESWRALEELYEEGNHERNTT